MTVKEFMALWVDNVSMAIYQEPIAGIDKSSHLVRRQSGSVDMLINSNQNYLDFNVVNLQDDDGVIVVVCRANQEQEQRTIKAHLTTD